MDRSGRIESVSWTSGCDVLLLEDRDDIHWMTGFSGSIASLLIDGSNSSAYLLVDARYVERASDEVSSAGAHVEVVVPDAGRSVDEMLTVLSGGRAVGLDGSRTTLARARRLATSMTTLEVEHNVADLRRVKSAAEAALMAEAARIATDALLAVVADGLSGRTERAIRGRLDSLMIAMGADEPAFPTIVASGPRAARPHHEAGDDVVSDDDMVIVDMGARVQGYRSDMTRTVRVGNPGHECSEMFSLVLQAQQAGVEAVRAGVVGFEVDAAARRVFRAAGREDEFVHGTGHGVGLAIHETPILGPRCEMALLDGEVVTVEPGLYRVGVGGVRIEDLVVVGLDGCTTLTLAPKELSCPRLPRTI